MDQKDGSEVCTNLLCIRAYLIDLACRENSSFERHRPVGFFGENTLIDSPNRLINQAKGD